MSGVGDAGLSRVSGYQAPDGPPSPPVQDDPACDVSSRTPRQRACWRDDFGCWGAAAPVAVPAAVEPVRVRRAGVAAPCGHLLCGSSCRFDGVVESRPRRRRLSWRNSRDVRRWSAAVKARDGECLECGSTDRLHAHHVDKSPALRIELSNGRTLCISCHRKAHPNLPAVLFAEHAA